MRRVLEITSLLLFLAGLELAAGTLSSTLERLEETFKLTFAGESFSAPGPAFLVGSVLAVSGAVLGLLTIWARVEAGKVQPGPTCPSCGSDTRRMKRSTRHKLLAAVMGHRLTRRSCGRCNWAGLSIKH